MARTTPAWVSLSASLTLTAPPLRQQEVPTVRLTAWSANLHPTCAQTMAWVRRHGWEPGRCSTSSQEADRLTGPRAVVDRFSDGRGYAAALDKVELSTQAKFTWDPWKNKPWPCGEDKVELCLDGTDPDGTNTTCVNVYIMYPIC